MTGLSECPLCRADLDRLGGVSRTADGGTACPGCSADLTVYTDIKSRGEALALLARELISRGEAEQARQAIDNLARLVTPVELNLAPLKARLALLEGEFREAEQLAADCDPAEGEAVREAAGLLKESRQRARELYNYALYAARNGAIRDAAGFLNSAVNYDPNDPQIWTLKLKTDLLERKLNECYRDLAALDRLAARPPEYYRLEQLLPPLGSS